MLVVLDWKQRLDGDVFPILKDDRDSLPPELVKQALAWMESRKEEFMAQKATGQVILADSSGPARFHFGDDPKKLQTLETIRATGNKSWKFEMGSVMICLKKDNSDHIAATVEFIHCRCILTGAQVVGPQIRFSKMNRL